MVEQLRWYDSVWLNAWFAARQVVARVAPARLPEFVASFAPLRTDPAFSVRKLPGLLDADEIAAIRDLVRSVPREVLEMHELQRFGRLIVHDYPPLTALQQTLIDRVSQWAGEEVEPSYNFLCLYSQLGVCEPHMDAPSAKWTLDVCLDQSGPWPIQLSQIVPWPDEPLALDDDWQQWIKANPGLHFESQVLEPGDAVLFSGSSQWHYRDPLPPGKGRRFCDLLFFHFIPKGCAEIVRPANCCLLYTSPSPRD